LAHKRLKEKHQLKSDEMGDVTIREVAGDATARELLALACVSEAHVEGSENDELGPRYPRLFRDAEHVSDLTAEEIVVLFNAYLLVQQKYGPFEDNIRTDEEVDLWVKRLVEGGSELPLLSTTWPQLVELASLLAARTYSVSRILASHWSSLPDTLRSDLLSCSGDIVSYGAQPANDESTGSESSPDEVAFGAGDLSAEDAMDLARKLVKR
jgi:hypothetical protein